MRSPKLISALVLASSAVVAGPGLTAAAAGGFVPMPIPLRPFDVRDLGVTDVDMDGHLDVFTVNHSDRENILAGRGDGTFRQRTEDWRLSQDYRFPDLLYYGKSLPPPPADSVHVVWRRDGHLGALVIRLPATPVAGDLLIYSRLRITASGAIRHDEIERTFAAGVHRTLVRFTSVGRSKLTMSVSEVGIPVNIRLKTGTRILVGIPPVAAPSEFRLFRRDRHGAAWADIEGGPRPEVVYVRGGMKGKALEYPVQLFQELRAHREGTYRDFGRQSGLAQEGCSSQAAEWVDANTDGQLDLYVACNHGQRNRLYLQDHGRFSEQAQARGISDSIDPVVWLDADDDGDSDLVTVLFGEVLVYENNGGQFSRTVLHAVPARGIRGLSLLPAAEGNTLAVFANSGSGLLTIDPGQPPAWTGLEELGLPSGVIHGSWVDHDNDGDMDLFTVPGGLHEQMLPGVFSLAADQPPIPPGPIDMARIAWFDADEDGRLDFLGAFKGDRRALTWQITYAMNRVTTANQWLSLDLRGPVGNHSGIGATVVASLGTRSVTTRVGGFEYSRSSQGHHRMYLGLGALSGPVHLEVRWPDGTADEVDVTGVDRRITLRYGATSGA